MFKFGFSEKEDNDPPAKTPEEKTLNWFQAEEVFSSPQFKIPGNDIPSANLYTCGNFEIGYITVNPKTLQSNLIAEVEQKHSDLIIAKYEGGLKIWECTDDLALFIDNSGGIRDKLKDSLVLDLGCGSGVLGIIALECGAAAVHFQDYNKEVVEAFTIPNVTLNCEDDSKEISIKNCRFFAGDWKSLSTLISDIKYDFIFTSETIYNPDSYDKLISFFSKHLKQDGSGFLAAKGYYFGVGGSVIEFGKRVNEKSSKLKCESVWRNEKGVARKILQLKLKN